MDSTRHEIYQSLFASDLWIFAADTATHIYNRTAHKTNDFKIPILMIDDNMKSYIDKLKIFGCIAYIKTLTSTKKFAPKATRQF